MKRVSVRKWIIPWVALLLFGCATANDVRVLDSEIYELQKQANKIQQDRESCKNEMTALKDSYKSELMAVQKEVQKDITASQNETRKLQADLDLRHQNLQSDIRNLATRVEEYKEFLNRPSKEIDRVKEDIALRTKILEERGKTFEEKNRSQEERIRALEMALEERTRRLDERLKALDGKIEGMASKQSELERTALARETTVETKGLSTRVEDLYKDAYETFQKGDLESARRKFEVFLKQYPNTGLSDNAQFWIGETYYLRKDFERAILEYEKMITKYPEGDKMPAATLKQGLAFLELGDKTNGKNLLKRVIERYPHSEQADIAKKRLEGIK